MKQNGIRNYLLETIIMNPIWKELTREIQNKLPRLRMEMKITFKGNTQIIDAFNYKDPMLNDVLEWLDDKEICICQYVIDSRVRIHEWNGRSSYDLTGIYWSLSSPYLKDQSPNLISFLHDLIK